jgi:hypothetical protein
MKAIIGRLVRLEQRGIPHLDNAWKRSQQGADILLLRLRQLEASGEPYEIQQAERPVSPVRYLSIAETLPFGRQRAHERNRSAR